MSCVILLAADHPMPLFDTELGRIDTLQVEGSTVTMETPGFSIQPHAYYREAVEELGLNMKPWQYELNVEAREDEAALLRDYLNKHSIPGEQVELWNLWVGEDRGETVPCYRGRLADLDSHALDLLCNPPMEQDGPGQCRMIVTI